MLIWIDAADFRRRSYARVPVDRGSRADTAVSPRRLGLHLALARFPEARGGGDRLPRARVQPLWVRQLGCARGGQGGDGFHACRGIEGFTFIAFESQGR